MEKELEIEQTFNKPSITEWLAKVHKDLKGARSIESIQYSIEENLSINAIQAYSELNTNPILRAKDYLIAQHIDTHHVNCNENIKSLLDVGVNTLILNAYSDVDYAKILDGVVLDYIQIVIYPMDQSAETVALNYLRSVSADMSRIFSESTDRRLIHFPFDGSITDQLALLLEKVYKNNARTLLLILDAQKDFISEVSKIRTAHILLANLNKAIGNTINYNLLSHTKAKNEGVHELIQSTYMGLAAIIGEADGIVTTSLDPKYKLNAVHTFNLFTMESYLGKVSDPTSGSNLIEEMTELLCQESWKKFKALI